MVETATRHRRAKTRKHAPGVHSRGTSASARDDVRGADAATWIYLVCDGRTELNANGLLRGWLDPALDSVGLLQATMLGLALGRDEPQLVVSSPLRRAIETAEAVALRTGHRVETDERLIDRDYGTWAGRSPEVLIAEWGSIDEAPGVEPRHEVLVRAFEALSDLCGRVVGGGSAVMVSHDVVNRLLLSALEPDLGDVDRLSQETGCFNIIEWRDNRWSVLDVNNTPSDSESPWAP